MVNQAFPFDSDDFRFWPICEPLVSHALAAAENAERLHVAPDATGRLLNQVGVYFKSRAAFAQAKDAHERALVIGEATLGLDHPTVATRLNNLALVLRDQGDLDGARERHERALAIDEAAYGSEHPDVATDLNNLARVLLDQEDRAGARERLTRALAIFRASLGDTHPNTLTVKHNLDALG